MPLYQPPSIPGLTVTGGAVTINDGSADQDFRVESDDNTHMLFVDAGNNRVGMGTDTPLAALHIQTDSLGDALIVESTAESAGNSDDAPQIVFKSGSSTSGDYIGSLAFDAKNAGGTYDTYAKIYGRLDTTTEAQTAGGLFFQVVHQNAAKTFLWMEGSPTGTATITFNYNAINAQFAVFTGNSRANFYQDGTAKAMGSMMRLYQRTTAADMDGTGGSLDFMIREVTGNSDKTAARIGAIAETDWTSTASTQDAAMVFFTKDGSAGSTTEKMRITSAGNVGIGTTAPAAPLHIVNAGTGDHLILESTAANAATQAPNLVLYRNGSDTPLDNELIGQVVFRGENDNAQDVNYGIIEGGMDDVSDGSEDGNITFNLIQAGTLREYIRLRASTQDVVINDQGVDIDFRVEGDTDTNLLFTDASTDRVGIGLSSPAALLEVAGANKSRQGFSVANPGAGNLTAAAHAGAYIIESGDNPIINLPSTSTIGEQYCFIATHANGLTINPGSNNANGATTDITVAQYKAKTAIAIGSNNWVIIG